jgi:hypothetical protein
MPVSVQEAKDLILNGITHPVDKMALPKNP